MSSVPRVVVVGGGFAGLEAAFLLRMKLHGHVDLSLVAPSDNFVFRPNSIYIPFGADPDSLLVGLVRPLRKRHIGFYEDTLEGVDAARQQVHLASGAVLPYDYVVLATGAAMRPEEIPGLAEHASTIWTNTEMLGLRDRLEALAASARTGTRQRVVFLVPPNNKCAGPMYEMVFMLETWLRREGIRDQVDIAYRTFERSYIQAFGPRLHDVVTAEFAQRGIDGVTQWPAAEVREGEVVSTTGATEAFDHLIAFPPYISAMTYDGLPADDRGFLTTELETRQVVGHENVYAPGDAGDFPVKQAFLAFLQADAAAGHIASQIRDGAFEAFDPVSMCVMEMLDSATFAQVPLRLTGDPARPVEVRPDAGDDYKVGVSPIWRIGKKMLGAYLPMRFNAGEPFHAGAAWQMMDVGLKGMRAVLAD